jgi:hypothetical protein
LRALAQLVAQKPVESAAPQNSNEGKYCCASVYRPGFHFYQFPKKFWLEFLAFRQKTLISVFFLLENHVNPKNFIKENFSVTKNHR